MNYFWNSPLQKTVKSTERYVRISRRRDHLSRWFSAYEDGVPTSSNQGVSDVPFQRWFRFKEAFSPKFVADSLGSLPYNVNCCLEPFGGSGTTALTCRMLGIKSVTIEVNPFLADLIKAKITPIEANKFEKEITQILSTLRVTKTDESLWPGMPKTFTEPGVKERYIFPKDVYGTARAILRRSLSMSPDYQRLVRVLLGGVLVENSNVIINGKGRRYRGNWCERQSSREDLVRSFREAVSVAVDDIAEFSNVPKGEHRVIVGDTRQKLSRVRSADMAIFSPPYPNSFDYTDVYNVELWMLGYFTAIGDNRLLRQSTLRSHVQTKWADNSSDRFNSPRLEQTIKKLKRNKDQLWDANIPLMIRLYFEDLFTIFSHLRRILPVGHHAVVAIGDSQYANIVIDVSEILPEVVHGAGFRVRSIGEIRSMRSSSQHGGKFDLSEYCIVFERNS